MLLTSWLALGRATGSPSARKPRSTHKPEQTPVISRDRPFVLLRCVSQQTPSAVRSWARGFCPHGRPGPLAFGLCGRLPRHGVGGFMFNSSSSSSSLRFPTTTATYGHRVPTELCPAGPVVFFGSASHSFPLFVCNMITHRRWCSASCLTTKTHHR